MIDFKYKDFKFSCDIGTMTPLQYIRMINILEEEVPCKICELGSGISTSIFDVYCKKYGAVRFSIEHDESYCKKNSALLFHLKEKVQLVIGDNIYNNCSVYDGLEKWLCLQDKFDFVLIDGANDGLPVNNLGLEYARIQMLSFVMLDKLQDNSVVMFHDSERKIAQNTLSEFERLLKVKNYHYNKEVVVEKDKEIYNYNVRILGSCPELTIYKLWK